MPRSTSAKSATECATLIPVFGDQLDIEAAPLREADRACDVVLMMEVAEESRHVASHVQRTVLFLSAMRHFAQELREAGFEVRYVALDDADNTQSFAGELSRAIAELKPERVAITRPGEWRVLRAVEEAADDAGLPLQVHEDAHFYTTPAEFSAWAEGRKGLVLEYFYRELRKRFSVLMDEAGEPEGGAWNFDKENRKPFRGDVSQLPARSEFALDATTKEVMATVAKQLPDLPGSVDGFCWPVTAKQAQSALGSFVQHRLESFGPYQDAMVEGAPFMHHSLLSCALNLKLLDPRSCVEAAEKAFAEGRAPLASVEGFVRQVLGWREFIRGVYWHEGPDYGERNGLQEHGQLPTMYWDAQTDMPCMQAALSEVHENGYGHHIQRLMVTGNFALLAGVEPKQVSDWYLGMYVDGIDWVTLPNTLGMALHADGGVVGTKPYAASGQYIKRMSNYCNGCAFDPKKRHGDGACPMTTLYWDFLLRHEKRFSKNRRMGLTLKHVERMPPKERKAIQAHAKTLKGRYGVVKGP